MSRGLAVSIAGVGPDISGRISKSWPVHTLSGLPVAADTRKLEYLRFSFHIESWGLKAFLDMKRETLWNLAR